MPGLIAAVVAQLVMGRNSISPYQVAGRIGHLERRHVRRVITAADLVELDEVLDRTSRPAGGER